jgi:hypothetical protein
LAPYFWLVARQNIVAAGACVAVHFILHNGQDAERGRKELWTGINFKVKAPVTFFP